MNKQGSIIIIDDDADDQLIFAEAFKEIGCSNKIVCFGDGMQALKYVEDGELDPFLILSDVNMPKLNGLGLKNIYCTNPKLNHRCVPYLFFTTAANHKTVYEAYTSSAQGFFVKPAKFEQLKKTLNVIVEYWQHCCAPNSLGNMVA